MIQLFCSTGRALLFCAALASLAAAQPPRLGHITFPTSGRADAQPEFVLGVLYMHSFEYDSAAKHFRAAQRLDPAFVMAFWGEALSLTHPVWMQQDLPAARAILNRLATSPKARRSLAGTAREKRWLQAVEVLYGEGAKEGRDSAYANEMERFSRDFPGDHEVQAFYALSLLGLAHTGRHTPTYMRAAALMEEVFRENPQHPGAIHYLIHAYDDPTHAPLGLRAARAYSDVAPSAAHAQHMTSHIFVAMGMWDDVERSNLAAWEASNRRNGHYTQWLSYGYLQKGRNKDAARFVDAVVKDAAADPTPYKLGYMNTMLAAYIVDTEDWNGKAARYAADSAKRVGGGAWRSEASAIDFAVGLAAVRSAKAPAARLALDRLDQPTRTARTAAGARFVAGLGAAEVMRDMLAASIMASDQQVDSALVLAQRAAEYDASLPYEFGPPETIKPPYELLGELLLAAARPAEARTAFERALARTPNRSRTMLGLARTLAIQGDREGAQQYYARFLANCSNADTPRPEIVEAEKYVRPS